MLYLEYDSEFHGDNCAVTGVAVYTYDLNECFDADHGGRDGLEVTNVELLRVDLDGVRLTRDQIELIVGKSSLESLESAMAETLQRMSDDGDLL